MLRPAVRKNADMRKLGAGIAGVLLAGLLTDQLASQPTPPTQCVTNAVAGGTVDAITVPLLPCGLATNLLLLTTTGANTTTSPTLQQPGGSALPILNADGTAVVAGILPTSGSVVELTSTGSSWLLLSNGVNRGSSHGTLTFGTHLTAGGSSYNGSANVTITTDGTSTNTASTLVARDGSGNFSAGTITASLTGHASLDLALSALGAGVQTLLGGTSSGTGGPAGTTSPTFTGTITAATTNLSGVLTLQYSNPQIFLHGTEASAHTWNIQEIAGVLYVQDNNTAFNAFSLSPGSTGAATFLGTGGTSFAGPLTIAGSASGIVSIKTQAAAGTYNFNLPTTAGTTGQVLTSAGGGGSPMTWTTIASTPACSWTPTDTSGGSLTLTTAVGCYQLGNMVYAYGQIAWPMNADATNNAMFSLPVAVPNHAYAEVTAVMGGGGQATGCLTIPNSSNCTIINTATGGALKNNVISTQTFNFIIIYPAN